ncbi:MAG: aldo/keto reductase [Chlorobi bacterium]|nr:aldo/keto reductase [Chlorobiota bacterium]MCI0716345.1 aldo/keto reductase [Chlorobiota bacterium]
MLKSKAAASDTLSFSKRYPELMHKLLGKTGLTVSACGFGSYRVDYRVKEHFDALEYAIESGINLIDTSANYSDGGSEILVGNVLLDLINQGEIKREEIVVMTKGGYLQGKNLELAKKMKEEGKGYNEIVEYTENLWHSIHPDFLKDQITLSLEKMKLESADVYLLHNPEYFLDSPTAKELEQEELRHEYYSRIKKAFEYLESEVTSGRISCYGISSNAFVKPSDDQVFTSLDKCLGIANEISTDNHFYVIQFPLNALERGAIVHKNQTGDTKSLIEFAGKHGLGILINRPLNALNEKGLNRLADFEVSDEFTKLEEAQIIAEINLLDSMEEDFLKDYIDVLNLSDSNRQAVNYFLKAGQLLKENWKNFGSAESFNDVKKQFLIPRVNYALTALVTSPNLTDEMKTRLDKIAVQINKLIKIMDSIYGLMANVRSRELHLRLNTLVEQSEADKFIPLTLSQKAVLMLNSIDEVSCTLVGMRQKKYVDDVSGSLKAEKISNVLEKWKKFEP